MQKIRRQPEKPYERKLAEIHRAYAKLLAESKKPLPKTEWAEKDKHEDTH